MGDGDDIQSVFTVQQECFKISKNINITPEAKLTTCHTITQFTLKLLLNMFYKGLPRASEVLGEKNILHSDLYHKISTAILYLRIL